MTRYSSLQRVLLGVKTVALFCGVGYVVALGVSFWFPLTNEFRWEPPVVGVVVAYFTARTYFFRHR
jgi:hypothetical protein